MCGIAGMVADGAAPPPDPMLVRTMCALIEHRGPDDEGYFCDDRATLGMRRLSIIDVSGGQQPVRNEDGTVWAVFNGEIYNFRQLRADLELAGHVFVSHSDTETIVHAYEAYHDDFPNHLEGMFSIALWDARRRRLLLVRDRFGKKPLFYARLPSGLAFGSELKCLMCLPELDRDVDPLALDEFLAYGYAPAPRSILRAVRKVRPGHLLIYDAAGIRERAYWSLPPRRVAGELGPETHTEAVVCLENLLEQAVRKRLVSDVPLGAFLSSGLDSSVVVAMMARLSAEPVRTFTIAFEDQRFNEAPAARRTARALGTEHREFVVRPVFEDVLPTIIWGMDEPQADSSAVPTYYVSRVARQYVTVSLTGDGGDEAFAGYTRYAQLVNELVYDRIPSPARSLARRLGHVLPPGLRGKGRLTRLGSHWQGRYASAMTIFDEDSRTTLYHPDWADQLDGTGAAEYFEQLFQAHTHPDQLSAVQWVDFHSYLSEDILAKVDRMSMVNSLETRAPLLDHHLTEFVFQLPSSAFHAHGMGKLLFRAVAHRLLPAELLELPKSGFGIPLADWVRGPLYPLVADALLTDGLARRGWFTSGSLARLVREHVSGHFDHGARLWALMCLELWARQFLDSSPSGLARPLAPATIGS